MVITAKLPAAIQAGEPQADIYLEEPTTDSEVAALLIEMMTAERDVGSAIAANNSGQ